MSEKYYCPKCDDFERNDKFALKCLGPVRAIIPMKHNESWLAGMNGVDHWSVERWQCPNCLREYYRSLEVGHDYAHGSP